MSILMRYLLTMIQLYLLKNLKQLKQIICIFVWCRIDKTTSGLYLKFVKNTIVSLLLDYI